DSLAAEGIRFNSPYTCSPVCTPARAGLFTGIYANQSGPWTNNIAPGKNISTMGRYFKITAYHTNSFTLEQQAHLAEIAEGLVDRHIPVLISNHDTM
ncbi:sulfatase-like hydrolase/transferase, partial [Escherichia coli]|uniref:sulfatase-like hydrolase/transferase n=1 Tax=Escherichia coli TaxID=562 RepID=UPI00210EE9B5